VTRGQHRGRRRPAHLKAVSEMTGDEIRQLAAGAQAGRTIRFTGAQLITLTDALSDAAWTRRRHQDPQGQNEIQAAEYEALARHCGLNLDDGEDPS
jgi:hypothetical protein